MSKNLSAINTNATRIRVFARCRPLLGEEVDEKGKDSVIVDVENKAITVKQHLKTAQNFVFDGVFGPDASQEVVFEQAARDCINVINIIIL
jgi:hypothetical protein